jgi:hypothetical protein
MNFLPAVPPDFNADGYVDSEDYGMFASCVTGPAVAQGNAICRWADFDHDGDVDQTDFGVFQRCYSGGKPADPNCTLRR